MLEHSFSNGIFKLYRILAWILSVYKDVHKLYVNSEGTIDALRSVNGSPEYPKCVYFQ